MATGRGRSYSASSGQGLAAGRFLVPAASLNVTAIVDAITSMVALTRPSPATSLILSISPSSGTTSGTTATVTVTPDGPIPTGGGTASLGLSGGGTLGATTLNFAAGSSAAQSTTISRSADGTSTVTLTNSMGLSNAGTPATFASSTPVAPSGGAMAFSLIKNSTATGVPFCLGFAFRQGDIPSGSGVVSNHGTLQVTPKNYWPDGSLKFAVLSGTADITGGTPRVITLSAGTSSTGTPLATSGLPSGIRTTGITVDAGAFGSASWSGADFDSPFMTWVSGHRMSSWIYRKQVGADAHLVAWLRVRLYAGGEVEVLPWIENGYLNVAAPTNKSATYSFSLGGTVRNGGGAGQAIDLKHHQRTPLLSGAALGYWLGADPGVAALPDRAYLQSTEQVPTYGAKVAAGASIVTGLPSTYTPLQIGSWNYGGSDDMGATGYRRPIGLLPEHDALYFTAAESDMPTVFAAIVRNSYGAGRYGIHFRDETTQRAPRFSSYPTLVLASSSGLKDTGASTTNTRTPTASGGNAPVWDTAHCPSVGFLAYLLTGDFYHLEETQFAATANHFNVTDWARGAGSGGSPRPGYTGASGVMTTFVQTRSKAWWMRSVIQALAATPDDDTALRAEFANSLQNTIDVFHSDYQISSGGGNSFGWIQPGEPYTSPPGTRFGAAWQQDFVTAVYGYALAMNLPISSPARTKLAEFFAWKAKSVIGRLGHRDNSTDWPYEDAAPYILAMATSETPNYGTGTGMYASWRAAYDATVAARAESWSTQAALLGLGFPDASAPGYWHNMQPAIAYAVRHSVPGAAEAYSRLTTATNFALLQPDLDADPVWSVKPAVVPLPTYLQGRAKNVWFAVPNTTVTSHSTSAGPVDAGILHAYSGLTVVYTSSGKPLVVKFGGGHGTSSDNSVLGTDLGANAPAIQTLCEPTPVGQRVMTVNGGGYDPASLWWPVGSAGNQKPNPHHTRSASQFVPRLNSVLWFGRGGPWSFSGTPPDGNVILRFMLGTLAWAQPGSADDLGVVLGSDATCQDTAGNVYTLDSDSRPVYRWTPGAGNSGEIFNNDAGLNYNGFGGLAFDSRRQQIFRLGNLGGGATPRLMPLAGGISTPTLTGDSGVLASLNAVAGNDTPGLVYDPANDRYIVMANSGGNFFAIDAATFAVTLQAPSVQSGPMPGPYSPLGYFGRSKVIKVVGKHYLLAWPVSTANAWLMPLED